MTVRHDQALTTPVDGYQLSEAIDDAYQEAKVYADEQRPTTDDRLGRRAWALVTVLDEPGVVVIRTTFDARLLAQREDEILGRR